MTLRIGGPFSLSFLSVDDIEEGTAYSQDLGSTAMRQKS